MFLAKLSAQCNFAGHTCCLLSKNHPIPFKNALCLQRGIFVLLSVIRIAEVASCVVSSELMPCGLPGSLARLDDNHTDIIFAAVLVCQFHQLIGSSLGVADLAQHLLDLRRSEER